MDPNIDPKEYSKIIRESMETNSALYLLRHGEAELKEEIKKARTLYRWWNDIFSSSIPFSLQTVEVMLLTFTTIPQILGFEIMKNQIYLDRIMILSAMRSQFVKEREEKMKAVPGDLSTPTSPRSKKA